MTEKSFQNKENKDPFEKERIYNYVKLFSFPRLSGTDGEKKAVNLCINTFKDIGFNEERIEKEPFKFSDFYSTTLVQLIMIMCLTIYLILLLIAYVHVLITLIAFGAITIMVFLIVRGLRHPESGFWGDYFGETFESTNVIAKVPALTNNPQKTGNIIISAHLDSKSQSFKTAWRIVLYRFWLFGGIILGLLYLSSIFLGIIYGNLGNLSIIFQISIWGATGLVSFSNVMLMFLTTHNKSPGALDNASGMSLVFELSSYFKDNPLTNCNLWFCQFSAEELGTMGSRHFVTKNEEQFEKGKVFQINMDMVSSAKHSDKKNKVEYLKSYGVLPRKIISPLLGMYLDRAAKKEKLKIRGFHLSTGAHLDSVSFHLRGYDAIDIATRAAARYTHNKVDTPDKVDPDILFKTCKIVYRAILDIDKEFHKLDEIRSSLLK